MNIEQEEQAEEEKPSEQAEAASAENAEAEESSKVEETAKPSHEPFIATLHSRFLSEEIAHQVRVTSSGLFVDESLFMSLLKHYQDWCQENGLGNVSQEKVIKKLFLTDTPELFYLVEGKTCLVGFFVAQHLTNPSSTKIPLYQGSLQTAKDYLHPRDPIFASQDGIEGELKKTGFELKVQAGKFVNTFNLESLRSFANLAQESRAFQKMAPGLNQALRNGLPALVQLLKKVRPPRRGSGVLIPAKYRSNNSVRFLTFRQIVVVKEADAVLNMYDLGGRNLSEFLKEEINIIRGNAKLRKVGSLQVFDHLKGYSFASVQAKRDRFTVELAAFRGFVSSAPLNSKLSSKFRKPYTTLDALRVFSEVAAGSVRVEARDIPRRILEGKPKGTRIRVNGDWVILMTPKNAAFFCCEKQLSKGKSFPKKGGKKKVNTKPKEEAEVTAS